MGLSCWKSGLSPTVPTLVLAVLLLLLLPGGSATAQGGRPLADNFSIKLGVISSDAFVNVTRNRDGAEANLVADSDTSPFISFATPPFFVGDSGLALGVALSYSEFTSSQQQFSGADRPESIGSRVDVQMTIIAPTLSYYFGRNSTTQYLRVFAGQGFGYASMSGKIEFGGTQGAEPPEDVESPSGATPAVAFGLEYRYRFLSLAYNAGGPKIETENHTYTLGDNSTVLAIVINL